MHLNTIWRGYYLELERILVESSIIVKNIDTGQLMSDTTGKVIKIMARSDLDNSCAQLHVYKNWISNDGKALARKRMYSKASYVFLDSLRSNCDVLKMSFFFSSNVCVGQ